MEHPHSITFARMILVAMTLVSGLPRGLCGQATSPQPWSALDARRTLAGAFDEYLAFIEQNWVPARREAMRLGLIQGFAVHTMPVELTAPGGWNVMLVTVYPDSTAAARAEDVFEPILRSRPMVRINGKGPRDLAIGLWSATVKTLCPNAQSTVGLEGTSTPDASPPP